MISKFSHAQESACCPNALVISSLKNLSGCFVGNLFIYKLSSLLALQSQKCIENPEKAGIEHEVLLLFLIFLIYFLFHLSIPEAIY